MIDQAKKQIIKLFDENVRGRSPIAQGNNAHDGRYGHWLEQQMGVPANGTNAPDLFGYEMKNATTSGKTTFGDWSASQYLFNEKHPPVISRDDFMKCFGNFNDEKKRYSWSGANVPTYLDVPTRAGEIMELDGNDVVIKYYYSLDQRANKNTLIPKKLQIEGLLLAHWSEHPVRRNKGLRKQVENKFNDKGWFKCLQNSNGVYDCIVFGEPITYENWINLLKSKDVFFDSGMYQGNARPYSQWRASNKLWDSLIVSRH
jgi:hypothetical protein